jgi:CubicO group peptidase (beta-lactamase class C family)
MKLKLRIFQRMVLAIVFSALVTGCSPTPRQTAASIDSIAAEEMTKQRYPGLAIAVVQRGELVSAKGFGLANLEHSVPVTKSTIFQTASLGKQFTAVAIMLQVEDGVLALDDAITKFFPSAPKSWNAITVRHLLTHTSGIPDYEDGKLDYRKDYTEEELVQFAFGLPPEFPAGLRWSYSNTAYILLGAIVRKASGQFYGDVLRDRVFAPLGMSTARVISEEDVVKHRAAGYRLSGETLKNQEWVAPKLNTTADGSLYLSLQDWLVWEGALRNKAVLRASSWETVFTPVRLSSGKTYPYGLGWDLHDGLGPARYSHDGQWQGFTTAYLHAIDADLSVIALGNLADGDPMKIVERIAEIYVPDLLRPVLAKPTEPDPAIMARVRVLLEATMAGTLRESEFEFLGPSFFPAVPSAYKKLLDGSGPVQRIELLEQRGLGDDTVLKLRAVVGGKSLLLDLSITPTGRLSSYRLRAEPSAR